MRRLVGHVRLAATPSRPGGVLHVRVEEVSRADAPASLIAYREVSVPPGAAADDSVDFTIDVPEPDPGQSLIIRAHLDMSGDGEIAAGDMITTQSYPILQDGDADELEIVANPV